MAAPKGESMRLHDRTLRPEQFLDPDNAPEFSHRLAVTHFIKNHEELELQTLLQEIHRAERNARRNELLLAKGRQYLQAFEAKKDVCYLKEYLQWLRNQDAVQEKAAILAKVERERERKQRMQTLPQEVVDGKVAEANKVKITLAKAFQVRDALRKEQLQQCRERIQEMKEQAAYNKVQIRNRHAKEAQGRNVLTIQEREEANRARAQSRLAPDRPPPSPPHSNLRPASIPRKSIMELPPSVVAAEQKEELERLMEEMERAQAQLRESRREFDLVAQKTAGINLCLSAPGLRGRTSSSQPSQLTQLAIFLTQ